MGTEEAVKIYVVESGDYEQRGVHYVISHPDKLADLLRRDYAKYVPPAFTVGDLTSETYGESTHWQIVVSLSNGAQTEYEITEWELDDPEPDDTEAT